MKYFFYALILLCYTPNITAQSCVTGQGNIGMNGVALDGTASPFEQHPTACLPNNGEANNYRGFMVGCSSAQADCPVTATAPTFDPPITLTCDYNSVTYTQIDVPTTGVFLQYWNECLATVPNDANYIAARQGFVNQLFCGTDVNGYPSVINRGTPISGNVSALPSNGIGIPALLNEITPGAGTNCSAANRDDLELIQADFWMLVPAYFNTVGFKLSGVAADAGLFMVGPNLANLCATAETIQINTSGSQIEGLSEAYYTLPASVGSFCGLKVLRGRLYISDIAVGFNVTPQIDEGNGFTNIAGLSQITVVPATSASDNTPPVLSDYTTSTVSGFQDEDGNFFIPAGSYDPLGCDLVVDNGLAAECSAVPIILSSFSAATQGENGFLIWVTSSEANSSHFEIQCSTDGLEFFPIDTIVSQSNNGFSKSDLTYEYTHKNASEINTGVYYRIKQIDLNGEFTYTPVRSVYFDEEARSNEIVIFPNPVRNNEQVVIKYLNMRTVSLYSSLGQLISIQKHNSPVSITSVNTSTLEPGVYFVKINGKEVQQILVY